MAYTIMRSDGSTYEVDEEEFDADRTEPTPEQAPAPAAIVAQARLQVADFEVFGINGQSGLSGAFVIDAGLIFCEFRTPLPWSDYIVTPTTSPPHMAYVDPEQQMAEGFLLCTQDGGGPAFPATIQLLVTR